MTVINLEAGMPTVATAKNLLSQSLRTAKANGSTGKGGAIRSAVRRELQDRKRQGQVRLWIPGEDFSPFSEDTRQAVGRYPELAKDQDYARTNHGITIVVL